MIHHDDEPQFSASEALSDYLDRCADAAWDRDDVADLLDALAMFFWQDVGDEWQGFTYAYHGLRIATDAATRDDGQEFARRFLHHVGMTAAWLAVDVEGAEHAALSRIAHVTEHWTRLDFPGALVPAIVPGVNDAATPAIN